MIRRLALISVLLVGACAAGPDYRAPAGVASGPFVAASPAVSAAPVEENWWRLFEAPALDGLIAQALAANKDIAVATANLAQVRAALSEARSARLPATAVSGSAGRVRQLDATGAPFESDAVTLGFDLAYEVDFFGRVGRSVEAARANAEAAEAALDVVRVAVVSETARAYADACAGAAQLAVAERTLALQQQTFDLTRRQLDAGRGTGLDTARAATAVESARATLPSLQAQREQALFRLAVLTGRRPGDIAPEIAACATTPQVAQVIPAGDGAGLLARRPDVRQAERQLAAATARIGVATADLYPSVRLGGSIASTALQGQSIGDAYTFSLGPLVSWSFPNIAAARARIAAAGAGADAALANFERVSLVALQETETALSQYARELDRRAALTRARDEAQRAATLARRRFDSGYDSFLEVLDAERTLAGLEAQLAQSNAAVTTGQIAVFKALGGGWAS